MNNDFKVDDEVNISILYVNDFICRIDPNDIWVITSISKLHPDICEIERKRDKSTFRVNIKQIIHNKSFIRENRLKELGI